jgi:acetyl-CoA acetyltransferase
MSSPTNHPAGQSRATPPRTPEREIDPRTPVLVGVGICQQRVDDAAAAREPMALMIDAARAAAADAAAPSLLPTVQRVSVPIGRWEYGNPGAMVASAIGAMGATTVSALPGVSQQTILSEACSAIAAGEIEAALIVGGEAGHRSLRARIMGVDVIDTANADTADVVLEPTGSIIARHEIRDARIIAFPYTKHHVSNWSVDQATALLLTSAGHATAHGVPRDRWIFPHVFSESNHPVEVSARRNMHRCEGAELAAAALLDAAGCTAEDIDLAEFYTCFPIAVDVFADAIGIADDRPTSFTGAMPFAGGPFNNFALHSTAQLVEHLRLRPGSRGLVTTVSGVLTKYGLSLWGTEPNANGYQFVDVTDAAREATPRCDFDLQYEGPARVVSYTVTFAKSGPQAGVIVVDTPTGARRVVSTTDPALMAQMQAEEFCGRSVLVGPTSFTLEETR